MNVSERKQWLEYAQASSIPLRCLDDNSNPVGLASGCMIDYRGIRILLSVFHATSKPGKWALEMKFERESKRTQLYYPEPFNFIKEMKLGTPMLFDVDYSHVQIPSDITSTFQEITVHGDILSERSRPVFSPNFTELPNKSDVYAFSGQIKPEFVPGLNTLVTEHCTYAGLTYVRSEGAHHYFKIPVPHPGHEQFHGCSGAPIIDSQRNVVALVCGGDIETNEIRGINLAKYKVALDISYFGSVN